MQISKDKITMRCPDNWHAHYRQGEIREFMIQSFIANGWRGRVQGMPNTNPPLLTGKDALIYYHEISKRAQELKDGDSFEPVISMQITEETTPEMIEIALALGIFLFKVYPRAVTTNSKNGVVDYEKILPALHALEGKIVSRNKMEHGAVAQFHGESPDRSVPGIRKESSFVDIFRMTAEKCPKLRMVWEHITTREALAAVESIPNARGTIAVQYLYHTMDDIIGYSEKSDFLLRPHNMCKPIAKFEEDKRALIEAATSGNYKFFYGGDDAPHVKGKKECAGVCAGVFNTLTALPTLIEIFFGEDRLERLESFLSVYGSEFYGFYPNTKEITFVREDWIVPEEIPIPGTQDTIVPWRAGEILKWKLAP